MTRLLKRADTLIGGASSSWRDHCRAAKKRARKIQFTRGRPNRVQLYRELISITGARPWPDPRIRQPIDWRWRALRSSPCGRPRFVIIGRWSNASSGRASGGCWPPCRPRRREAGQPVRSAWRYHRQRQSRRVSTATTQPDHRQERDDLDLVIEAGNPADSDRLLPMLERHVALYGQAPRQAAADGGFATRRNLATARRAAFATWPSRRKPAQDRGHRQKQMGLSQATQLPLRHRSWHLLPQRATAGALHLARSRSLQGLRRSSVVAYNLVLFSRLERAKPTCIRLLTPAKPALGPRLIMQYATSFADIGAV